MTATFSSPMSLEAPNAFAAQLKTVLLEPLIVVAACIFWVMVLPVTGLFCASVAVYDKLASLNAPKLRLPDLRHTAVNNPLVLRRSATPKAGETATSARAHAAQA